MTASHQPESKSPSRRAILAGALAGIGAVVAKAVGAPTAVRAADDGTSIVIGGTYADVVGQTTLGNDNNANRVLWVASNTDGLGAHGDGVAITGFSAKGVGVEGWSGTVRGVYGHAVSTGVEGEATLGTGIYGHTSGFNQMGINGESTGGGGAIGVRGWVSSVSGTGVIGAAGSASGANFGVRGLSASPSGTGVLGEGGKGIWGYSTSGVGLYGQADTGLALQTAGRAKFSTSGLAIIPAGATSKTVTPGVDVNSASFVLLTPKANLAGRDLWFTTDSTNNRFTIRISAKRSASTRVAWLLLG